MTQNKPWFIIHLPTAHILEGNGNLKGWDALRCDTTDSAFFETKEDAELALVTYLVFSNVTEITEHYEIMQYED